MSLPAFNVYSRRRALRVGFVAQTDAAPLIIAKHLGVFARRGLDVELQREIGWAGVRDKIIHGELDAAQAPAPLLWSTRLGYGCAPCDVLTALVLGRHGSAITLAQSLWQEGVRDAETFRARARRRGPQNRFRLGIPFHFSSLALLLRRWLTGPESMRSIRARGESLRDVEIVVVPAAQMVSLLARGVIHGFCSGEPWNSLAVRQGVGWCAGWSAALTPGATESVLMVRRTFAENYPREHAGLVAAVVDACEWCERAENRPRLAEKLAEPDCIGVSREVLLPPLSGQLECGNGVVQAIPDFFVFHGGGVNAPSPEQARALQMRLLAAELIGPDERLAALPERLFRADLHCAALQDNHAAFPEQPPAQRLAG